MVDGHLHQVIDYYDGSDISASRSRTVQPQASAALNQYFYCQAGE